LALASLSNFGKWEEAMAVFEPFKHAVHLAGSNDAPMSAYLPIIIALKNEFDAVLARPSLERNMGEGTAAALAAAVNARFNFSGDKPTGTSVVGFLDKYQLYATALDPYARSLSLDWDTLITGGISAVIHGMSNWAFPGEDPSAVEKRSKMHLEYLAFHTGTGSFAHKFDLTPSFPVGHKFNLTEIGDYIDRTGRHDSRLAWWTVHASSCILYQAVARPLLSVRVTGSMTVERVAKPLKNRVMTKERSRLSSEKSSMLLRVGLNLRFLQASKSKLWDSDDE